MVTMLAERDRLASLPQLAAYMPELLLDAQRIVTADVVTATPLTDASRAAFGGAGPGDGQSIRLTERSIPLLWWCRRASGRLCMTAASRQLERMRDKHRGN
jgi:hypothetical protein